MATGFVLNIPKEMLSRLDEADRKIEQLEQTASKTADSVVQSFLRMKTAGVDAFISSLNGANKALANLNKIQAQGSGLQNIGVQANNSVDEVHLLIASIYQLMDLIESGKGGKNKTKLIDTDGDYKRLADLERELSELQTIKKRGGSAEEGALDEARERALVNEIYHLKELIKWRNMSDQQQETFARNQERRAERIAAAEKKRQVAELAAQRASTPAAALAFSESAASISQRTEAIKYLQIARDNLLNTDTQYEKKVAELNAEIRRQQTEVDRLRGKSDELHKSHRNLMDISGQLARRLALVFSVSQMTGYFNKLIQVRGELELQQRSLQAILQNKDEADTLWNKTIALAVKSPFQIKELVTYTKQLAAYRVENDKLYDTTKMLADISAGLGVDMQRLILAYGQVKAANYLRGTELRQFSEAGINILGELAKYFTKLEGNAVSVADVFDRVSRRMVTFEDVEQIFKRMTSAGGTFYRMQEIQAETLQGQISNLKDSLTIMLNEIGMVNEGSLKSLVAVTRDVVENWEAVATALKAAIAVFAIYRLQTLATSQRTKLLAIDMGVLTGTIPPQLSLWQLLSVGLRRVGASMKAVGMAMKSFLASNIYLLAITALIAGIRELWQWNKRLKENIVEAANARDVEIAKINATTKAYRDLIAAKKEEGTITVQEEEIEKTTKATLAQLQEFAAQKGLLTFQSSVEFDQADIDSKINMLTEQLNFAENFGQELELALQNAFDGVEFGGVLGDNLKTDLQQLDDAFANLERGGLNNKLQQVEAELDVLAPKLTGFAKNWYNELKKGQRDSESDLEYLERRISLLSRINKEMSKPAFSGDKMFSRYQLRNATAVLEAEQRLLDVQTKRNEAAYEFNKILTRTGAAFGIYDFTNAPAWQQEAVSVRIKASLDKESLSEDVKRFAEQYLSEGFKVPLIFTPPTELFSPSEGWETRISQAFGEINERLAKKSEAEGLSTVIKLPLPTIGQEWEQFLGQLQPLLDEGARKYVEGQQRYNDVDKARTAILATELGAINAVINRSDSKNKTDQKSNDIWRERATLIRKVADEAASLNEYLTEEEVATHLSAVFQDEWTKTFGQLGIALSDFNWTSEREVREAFAALLQSTTDAAEQAKIRVTQAEWQVKLDIQAKKDSLEELSTQIEDAFDQYDLWLDLKKLGFSPDMAQSLFGLDTLSLDALSKQIKDKEPEFNALSEAGVKAYKRYLDKVADMERKAQWERLKTYAEYSKKAIGERAKIKLEEMRKLQEIEDTFIAKPDASADEVAALERAKLKAKEGVRKEATAKLQEYDWKEFQKTETFIHIMEDLENASDSALSSMIQQLESFRDQWTDMPVDQMKQIVDLIQKMEEARLDKLNPFGGARSLRRQIAADGRDMETAEMDMLQAEQTLRAYQNQLSVYEAINQKRAEGATNEQLIAYFGQEYADIIEAGQPALDAQLAIIRRNREQQDKIVKSAKNQIDAINKLNDLYKKQGDYYRMLLGMAQDLYSAFESLYEALGGDDDALGKVFADAGMQIMTSVLNTLALEAELMNATVQAGTLAAAMNAAAGVIGWIVMAVQILASILSAVFKAHDKGLENQIEHITERVENLQKHYEKLEEAIDKAYSTEQLAAYTKQLESTAKVQIAAIRSMIALEEAKKSVDEDRIEDWEKQIEDLEANLADALRDAVSTATDGILDDTLGTARDFVDAWYEAFSEVGDGLSGLQDNFQEMLANLVQQQATMQIAGKFLDRWKTYLGEYINKDDLELTTEEAQAFAARVKAELPELSAALEAFFSTMYDTIDGAAGGVELSGLQKGISSITEETAQILEAYLNSIRFYVADSNAKLAQIVASWANPEVENPIVSNLRIIAKQTSDIHTLLDSLTAPHPTEAGRGLKVII